MPNAPSDTTRSYLFRNNVSVAAADAQITRQLTLLEIKQSLIGAGSGWTVAGGAAASSSSPWYVVASSDSVTAQAADLWQATTDLVWGNSGEARSWCLFRHDDLLGTGASGDILIVCSQAAGGTRHATLAVFASVAGFSTVGMAPDTPPTAADVVEILPEDGDMTNSVWQGADTLDAQHATGWMHFHASTDGTAFRVNIGRGGFTVGTWDFHVVSDWLSTSWSHPFAFMINSIDGVAECNTWVRFEQTDPAGWVSRDTTVSPTDFRIGLTTSIGGSPNVRADQTSQCPLGGENTSGMHLIEQRGPLPATNALIGYCVDTWTGRTALAGRDYPQDGSARFAQFGDLIYPHDGSAINLS